MPAPSAVQAGFRFAELAEDPQVVASAQACRELKWCHQAYVRAERLLSGKPEAANEIFAEIVRRAPEDSEVYRAATRALAAMNRQLPLAAIIRLLSDGRRSIGFGHRAGILLEWW